MRQQTRPLKEPKVTGWGWFYLSTVLDDFLGTSLPGSSAPR